MVTKRQQYIIAGLPFIALGLLFNPWLIARVTQLILPTTLFSGLWVISIVMIVIGWGFIFKKEHFFKWAIKKYKSLAVIVLNLTVIFAVINFIAALFLYQPQKEQRTGAQSKSTAYDTMDDKTAGKIISEELPIMRLYRIIIGDTEEYSKSN